MTPDPTLTDEELAEMEDQAGSLTIDQEIRLIAALRASRERAEIMGRLADEWSVRAETAEIEAVRLRRYANHTHKCRMQPWFDDNWCTCGLDPAPAPAPTLPTP